MRYVYKQVVKGRTYYRFRRAGNGSIRMPDDPNSREFREKYDRLTRTPAPQPRPTRGRSGRALLRQHLVKVSQSAMSRARASDLPCDIDPDFILRLADEQDWRCAITGLQFQYETSNHASRKQPFRPSIDRIEPANGYVRGNVRLTLVIVNCAINDWGEDVFRLVCQSATAKLQRY